MKWIEKLDLMSLRMECLQQESECCYMEYMWESQKGLVPSCENRHTDQQNVVWQILQIYFLVCGLLYP